MFELARDLNLHNVPFVFVIGYDAQVIPAEFSNIERLQKPVEPHQVVSALAKFTGGRPN